MENWGLITYRHVQMAITGGFRDAINNFVL